jgi:nucleoside-diphosphate-sugar epimerase
LFIHTEDAARATVAAISCGAPGIVNDVDDEPAPISTWLPFLADVLGAKPPREVPVWLAKLLIGDGGVMMMTQMRGGSNAKAKRELRRKVSSALCRLELQTPKHFDRDALA